MSLPAKYPPAVTPANWNAMIDRVNGYTPSGTFVSPYTYVISTDDTYYYASNAFQIIYGGPDDAGGVDGTDPQAVFDACIASHKKEIVFATGTYTLDLTFKDTDSITIKGSNKNSVVINGVLSIQNCWGIDIKQLQLSDDTRTKTMILFKAENGESIWNCSLEDVFTLGGDTGIDFQTSGNGWINVNYFNRVWLTNGNKGMTQTVCSGTDKANGNIFVGLEQQCDASTTAGLILIKGTGNTYIAPSVFDAPVGVNRCTVATGGDRTTIIGGNVTASEFTDNGTWTVICDAVEHKAHNVAVMLLTNNVAITSWNSDNTATCNLIKMTDLNNTEIWNTVGHVILKAKDASQIILGATGVDNGVHINSYATATAESTLQRSQKLRFNQTRYNSGVSAFSSDLWFEPYSATSDVGRLKMVNVETSDDAPAGATKYLLINVDGVSYKIIMQALS